MYIIDTVHIMNYSKYQYIIPKKSCIYVVISMIPLSDTEMDYLRENSSNLGV